MAHQQSPSKREQAGQLSAESSVRSVSTVASRSGMGARQLPSQRPTGNWGASRQSGMPGERWQGYRYSFAHEPRSVPCLHLSRSTGTLRPHTPAGSSKRGYRPSTSTRRTMSSRAGDAVIDPFAPIKVRAGRHVQPTCATAVGRCVNITHHLMHHNKSGTGQQ